MNACGVDLPHLKIVLSSGDQLTNHDWQKLRDSFKCEVFNLYGGTEAPCIALGNSNDLILKVTTELYTLEIVDQNDLPCEKNETGRILITDLHSRALPIIRYEIGDLAKIERTDDEGRVTHISNIQGRCDEIIKLRGGKFIFPFEWHVLFRDFSSILNFNIIQIGPDNVQINLVVSEKFNETDLRKKLLTQMPPITFDIRYLSSLESHMHGKRRSIVAL